MPVSLLTGLQLLVVWVFQDPDCKKLAPSKPEIGTYITDTIKLVGSCVLYLVHPDTKCLQEVTFYVASNNSSVLLSCVTTLALSLVQPHTRLNYLPPRASLITSSVDHPKKIKSQVSVHVSRKESTESNCKGIVPKLVTSKNEILEVYSNVFDGIGHFPGPPYISKLILVSHPSKPPVDQSHCIFKKEINKMLQATVFKPVNQATPWINSFVLVEGKDKLGNLKLKICLDTTHLNIAIVHEPYHFKTTEDVIPLLAEACVITVCDYRKSYWHQQFDEASFLTTFNTELGRFRYTVMPFGATVASDVFQHKLNECFGKLKQVIIIADDIMVAGYKPDHSDHDQAVMRSCLIQ